MTIGVPGIHDMAEILKAPTTDDVQGPHVFHHNSSNGISAGLPLLTAFAVVRNHVKWLDVVRSRCCRIGLVVCGMLSSAYTTFMAHLNHEG